MATASSYRMAFQRQQSGQCADPSDMDTWLDFNALASPSTSAMSRKSSHVSSMASPASTIVGPVDVSDEHQTPVQPSHDYRRFRQTTGLPANSVAGLKSISESQEAVFADSFDAGVDDFSMPIFDGMGMGSNTGLGSMTGDFSFADGSPSMPAFFFPSGEVSQSDGFSVDPAALSQQEDSKANVRFYPGMHQQQAALAKAQAQANQLRQQQLMQQRQQQHAHRAGEDPHYEETIQRALAQIRQNSAMYADDDANSGLPHVVRSKKDEDDMDEDERLLNSEEGKKLSSKERRQLRNKVSARAFRSRRKEYIGQLENEINQKVTENAELKHANRALMGENEAFRTLAQVFVSHPAFRTVVADISRNPDLSAALAKMTGPSPQPQQQPAQVQRKDADPYAAAQMGQIPIPPQDQHIGMAMMPEASLDFSQLSLGGGSWAMPAVPMPSFQTPQVFAVIDVPVPEMPAPAEMSVKGESVLDRLEESFEGAAKSQEPELSSEDKELSVSAPASVEEVDFAFDESDEDVTLFASSNASVTAPTERPTAEDLTGKPRFALRVVSQAENSAISASLERLLARMDKRFERLNGMTSAFNF